MASALAIPTALTNAAEDHDGVQDASRGFDVHRGQGGAICDEGVPTRIHEDADKELVLQFTEGSDALSMSRSSGIEGDLRSSGKEGYQASATIAVTRPTPARPALRPASALR